MGLDEGQVKMVGIVVGVGVLLLVILLPMSFSTLEYYQMGFSRSKPTGTVYDGRVYEAGRYSIGPSKEFKKFQADAHFETFDRVTVFTDDKLQVTLTAHMQYFVRPHQLKLLHDTFDKNYADKVYSAGEDALKAEANLFTTREFIRERMLVEDALNRAVRNRLSGRCCEKDCELTDSCIVGCSPYRWCTEADFGLFVDLRYFQLGAVQIPSDLEEKYLRALVLIEETDAEELKQQATLERKTTESMVKDIENEAAEISETADATSELVHTTATANATAIREDARVDGLKALYDDLGFTTEEYKNSFDYLRTLMESDKVKLAVDFQQLIAGNMDNN